MMKLNRKQRSGFTLIELLIVIAVIAILAAIAIPNLLSSRQAANEASAIGSIRTINSAEATYRSRNNTYGTLANLSTGNLVDPALGAATTSSTAKSGYSFAITVPSGNTSQFFVIGTPATNGGARYFYTDETGVIYAIPSSPTPTLPTTDASGNPGGSWSQIGN